MSQDLTRSLPPDGVELILARLGEINARVQSIEGRLTDLESRLSSVEERLDRRLAETRPIWEQVIVRLDGVDVRLAKIEERQEAFDERLTRFDEKLTRFDEKLAGFDEKLAGFDEKLTAFDERFVLVDQRLTSIEQQLKVHDNKFDHLSLDMRAGFKRLGRELEQLSTHYIQVRVDQNDLERRMDYLEDKIDPNRGP